MYRALLLYFLLVVVIFFSFLNDNILNFTLILSLTHSFTHSFTHSLTYSLTSRNVNGTKATHSENLVKLSHIVRIVRIPWYFFLALTKDAPMTKLLVIFPSTKAVASVVSTPTMAVVAGDVYRLTPVSVTWRMLFLNQLPSSASEGRRRRHGEREREKERESEGEREREK